MNMDLPSRMKRGRPQWRFMHIMKEGTHRAVTEEDTGDRVRWRKMIRCGTSWREQLEEEKNKKYPVELSCQQKFTFSACHWNEVHVEYISSCKSFGHLEFFLKKIGSHQCISMKPTAGLHWWHFIKNIILNKMLKVTIGLKRTFSSRSNKSFLFI